MTSKLSYCALSSILFRNIIFFILLITCAFEVSSVWEIIHTSGATIYTGLSTTGLWKTFNGLKQRLHGKITWTLIDSGICACFCVIQIFVCIFRSFSNRNDVTEPFEVALLILTVFMVIYCMIFIVFHEIYTELKPNKEIENLKSVDGGLSNPSYGPIGAKPTIKPKEDKHQLEMKKLSSGVKSARDNIYVEDLRKSLHHIKLKSTRLNSAVQYDVPKKDSEEAKYYDISLNEEDDVDYIEVPESEYENKYETAGEEHLYDCTKEENIYEETKPMNIYSSAKEDESEYQQLENYVETYDKLNHF